MSNATKNTGTDSGKPSITDEKSDTNVPGDNKGLGYNESYLFVIIALIVLAVTILIASRNNYNDKYDYQRLILSILIMVLCAIIILRLGAVHWAFKFAVLIPFFLYLALFLMVVWFSWSGILVGL